MNAQPTTGADVARSSGGREGISDARHRVGAVAKKIQDHLLTLDTIAGHGREVVRQLGLHRDAFSLKIAEREIDDFPRRIVQVEGLEGERLFC